MGCGNCFKPSAIDTLYSIRKSQNILVHYLCLTNSDWQLVVYNLETKKYISKKLELGLLNPVCESSIDSGVIYCTGGQSNTIKGKVLNEVKGFAIENPTDTICSLAPMGNSRYNHSAIILNKTSLFVLGGATSHEDLLTSCEQYDIKNNCWIDIPSLNYKRENIVACIYQDKFIYVFGGKEIVSQGLFKGCIEFYDASSKSERWVVVHYKNKFPYLENSFLWCTEINEKEIIIFGTSTTTIFNTDEKKIEKLQDATERYVPDKRTDIKIFKDEVSMIVESCGNLAIFSIKTKKWTLNAHIPLGL